MASTAAGYANNGFLGYGIPSMVASFFGTSEEKDNIWISQIEHVPNMHGYVDSALLSLAIRSLRGNAALWYDTIVMKPQFWIIFKNLVLARYPFATKLTYFREQLFETSLDQSKKNSITCP